MLAFSNLAISPVICFTIFTVLAKRNGTATLTTTKAFTTLVLFNNLAVPITNLVQSLAGLATAIGSLERIDKFLLEESRIDTRLHANCATNVNLAANPKVFSEMSEKLSSDKGLVFDSRYTSSGWSVEKPPVVRDLNFKLQTSSLTMVIGPTGCGKSTFMNTLLGEATITNGYLQVSSTVIAYCSQTCWLKHDTLQNNILGESQFDINWYNTVLRACALNQDIKDFMHGDQSTVGSKGAVLSGGQKQRLVWPAVSTHVDRCLSYLQCLARALYSRIPTVILDDVFSGLDSTTEDHIFNALLGAEGIWRKSGTTIVATTNDSKLPRPILSSSLIS